MFWIVIILGLLHGLALTIYLWICVKRFNFIEKEIYYQQEMILEIVKLLQKMVIHSNEEKLN